MEITENILEKLKTGVCFPMGRDGTLWRVLEVNDKKQTALVIAAAEICRRAYHAEGKEVVWSECTLREWLNGEYYEKTFSEEEKAAIIECEIKNPDCAGFCTGSGTDTKDKIWLLSTDEAERYFKNDKDRNAGSWWWLRSPGCSGWSAANINNCGGVNANGIGVKYAVGVRPVVLLNLNSPLFQSQPAADQSKEAAKGFLPLSAGYLFEKLKPGVCFPMGRDVTLWRILEINAEQQTALVIADRGICRRAYNRERKAITWAECTLRKWLNGTYYEKTFSEEEKEAIIECEIKNPDNSKRHTRGGADTKDRIWLLSIDEAEKYFKDDEDRNTGNEWWLRSPGYTQNRAARVYGVGSVINYGYYVHDEGGVRPAFLLNLNSLFFQSLFSANQSDDTVIRNPRQIIKNDASADPSAVKGFLPLSSGYLVEKPEPGICFPMGRGAAWWRILEINAEKQTALVAADTEICHRAYDGTGKAVTWAECTLRKWLNGTYYEETFSEEEKGAIIECEIKNPDNSKRHTRGGADTKDRIWLLSIDEAKKYFKDNEDRRTGKVWWLRSPGFYQSDAAIVSNDGRVYDFGIYVNYEGGVRPAFLLNLNSLFFQSLLSVNQSGETMIRNPKLIVRNDILFSADPSVTEAALPSSVKRIASGAFRSCRKLTGLSWEADSMRIAPDAFRKDAD